MRAPFSFFTHASSCHSRRRRHAGRQQRRSRGGVGRPPSTKPASTSRTIGCAARSAWAATSWFRRSSGLPADGEVGRRISDAAARFFRSDFLPHLSAFPRVRELVRQLPGRWLSRRRRQLGSGRGARSLAGNSRAIADLVQASDRHRRMPSRSKPDPDIVVAALTRSGADPSQAIMVGDTPYDVAAAIAAGIEIVGVESGGWGPDELRGAVRGAHRRGRAVRALSRLHLRAARAAVIRPFRDLRRAPPFRSFAYFLNTASSDRGPGRSQPRPQIAQRREAFRARWRL